MICSLVLLLAIFIGAGKIGKAEYDRSFCEGKLELLPNEKAGLLTDYVNPYKEDVSDEKGHNTYGCCRIPDDYSGFWKSQNCIMTPDYKSPTIKEKMAYFLKRFK